MIDRLNWTGTGIVFPRDRWTQAKQRPELSSPGIYILSGYKAESFDSDLPTVYIGQGENIQSRIESHSIKKNFWDKAAVFTSANNGLNRAHITWLEYALINRAAELKQCHLDNGTVPQEPKLIDADKAEIKAYLLEILRILPLVNIRSFESPRSVSVPMAHEKTFAAAYPQNEPDTVIVPANKEGFNNVFLGENAWYAIRIGGGMLDKIKFIAAYQTAPISAVTHYAPVARIESFGDSGKYRLLFAEAAKQIPEIPLKPAPWSSMQGSRYTKLSTLLAAKNLAEVFNQKIEVD